MPSTGKGQCCLQKDHTIIFSCRFKYLVLGEALSMCSPNGSCLYVGMLGLKRETESSLNGLCRITQKPDEEHIFSDYKVVANKLLRMLQESKL